MGKRDFHTPEVLRQILDYEPLSGRMHWKARPLSLSPSRAANNAFNARSAGKEAFTSISNTNGYKQGKIFGVVYLAHRVVWALHHGEWPDGDIDHINRDRTDNRIENLRLASRSQNCQNVGLSARNSSGLKGVTWDSQTNKWRAQIRHDSKSKCLGRFSTKEQAHAAYVAAANKYHGEFANYG